MVLKYIKCPTLIDLEGYTIDLDLVGQRTLAGCHFSVFLGKNGQVRAAFISVPGIFSFFLYLFFLLRMAF